MLGIMAVGLTTGCTGGDGAPPEVTADPTSTTTTTTIPLRPVDGTLQIGVLLPTTGPAAAIGQPVIDALRSEVSRINAAGGVLGRPVTLVARDEGTSIASAALALDSLLQEDAVDAIIGPLSSTTALGVIGRAIGDGVVTCSPSAAAIALDDYPDKELFFRTIPSDTVLASALVTLAQDTGKSRTTIIYVDDPYGRGLEAEIASQARGSGLDVTESIGVTSSDESLVELIGPAVAEAEMVIVAADTETAVRTLTALDEIVDDDDFPVFLNDQVRLARSNPAIAELSEELRQNITVIAHRLTVEDSGPSSDPFVAHAIDCLGLIALAAEVAGSDQPLAIAGQMPLISVGGRPCRDFTACKGLIDGQLQIDFDGLTEVVNISRDGEQIRGKFEILGFGADGSELSIAVVDHLPR